MKTVTQLRALLVAAELDSKRACQTRANLPAGSSRARVTSANARWARCAEYRDRIAADLRAAEESEIAAAAKCPECGGGGVDFRGRGIDAEYRVCSRWKEPGHPTEDAIRLAVAENRLLTNPSGRYA